MLDSVQKNMLREVADLHETPIGAYNIRSNGKTAERAVTANIDIVTKNEGAGIDVRVQPGTKNESVHSPVIISESGLNEVVYNDFFIGEDADVVIVAGCGIHNCGKQDSSHSGIHRFFLERGAKVKYVEKHYGEGDGDGRNVMNPKTEVTLAEGAVMEMETVQIKGIDSTDREMVATVGKGAKLLVRERLMTHGKQSAISYYKIEMAGEGSSCDVVSRSVAKDQSYQKFDSLIVGNAPCTGHTECDAIIMDTARVLAVPELEANHVDASLIHEAAIGKIAGEQLIKLMTLGLTEAEAEEQIIGGFLR